ncbi:MAG: response regulator transcription factor [Ruminococcaceae bacterium]|nr:response regulator transcription factor [Oscillospiraceae bacterium]
MIWCVEDDASIREIEVYALRSTGFEAMGFEDGLACWQALKEQKPELIVLDVMLPELDGVQLLQKIRNTPALADLPILMATAKGAEFDKIQLLDLGADDYLVKPFGMMEMVSRVKAILRRCKKQEKVLTLGGLVLKLDAHTVTLDGVRVMLTFKEYELLRLFLSNLGCAFTREELLSRVWDADFLGQTRTVDMHIRTLRQKIGRYGACIETVRNVGYRMEARDET